MCFFNEKYMNWKKRLLESVREARCDVTFKFCGKSSKAKGAHHRCTTTNTECEARQKWYLRLELQFDKLLCKDGRCDRLPWWQSRTMVRPRKNASGAFLTLLSALRGVWVLLKPVSKAFQWKANTECKTLRVCLCCGWLSIKKPRAAAVPGSRSRSTACKSFYSGCEDDGSGNWLLKR